MALILHRSDRPLTLADEFAALLADDPLDVFTPEVVVVGARGVERWLTQRLSHRLGTARGQDGVCAGLDVHSLTSLAALLLGRERDDPWHADRLVWPVLEALDALIGEPEFTVVARHLGAGPAAASDQEQWRDHARRGRRYSVARRMAGLFASYARERPSVLRAWEAGLAEDGTGARLDDDLHWQPMLWRATVELVTQRGAARESPMARHERVIAELRGGKGAFPGLPGRMSLFGHSRLGEAEIELLDALATRINVHLWLPHPSPRLWEELRERTGLVPRADDDSGLVAQHPLLASLGRDVRELQRSLLAREVVDATRVGEENSASTTPTPATRLALLQHDIRRDVPPSQTPSVPASDRSLQVHACHGPARQVEVLRELLVSLLDESQGRLQPRDIIVMCPDVEAFAPLIHATFGLRAGPTEESSGAHPGTRIRVQLADRALASLNPFVEVAEHVLELVSGRMTAAEVLDLLSLPAVRRRFRLDEDDLELVARWVADAAVRWGIDGHHRREYGLGGLAQNTWSAGLDRLALGVAVSQDAEGDAGLLLPLDDVGSNNVPLVGAVLELFETLATAALQVRTGDGEGEPGTMSTSGWIEWLRSTVLNLAQVPTSERWQIAQFERELSLAGETSSQITRLRLTDVRVMVQQRWAARPTRSNFRTGSVTVCTMVPMRSVPHKVVIALGLDDGVFPRSPVVDGDDVLARNPLTGERDPRTEDAQLLLDAVMAAEETFIALYSGFDERSGSRRPPAVPLQELIAAAARTGVATGAEDEPIPPFFHLHPLQAFDERNFTARSFLPGGTYDGHALTGARALREAHLSPQPRPLLLSAPLPEQTESAVSLEDLVAFYDNPAREFLRRRLQITVPRAQDEPDSAIPVALDGLEEWKIGDRLLREVQGGTPLPQAVEAERRRGHVPPEPLADTVLDKVGSTVHSIITAASPDPHETVGVLLELPSGVRVRGVVLDVVGDVVETLTYSTVGPKHLISAWVRLLALAAAYPEKTWRSVIRGKRGERWLTAPDAARATELLDTLVAYRAKGMQFPLGIPPKTASAFTNRFERALRADPHDRAAAVQAGMREAERVWAGAQFPERSDDPWWARLYGPESTATDIDAHGTLAYWGPLVWSPIHAAGDRP